MAVGIRPNTELAEKMRLHCNRGIVVHDTMQTVTDAGDYSLGSDATRKIYEEALGRRCKARVFFGGYRLPASL